MTRRPARCLVAALASVLLVALAQPVATAEPVGSLPDSAAGASPAAEIVAARVPKGTGGGSAATAAATLDVEAQAVLAVTTTADDGSAGSLRRVIEDEATNAGGDVVVLQPGATYVLTCAAGGSLEHGDTPLEIEGNGATITMEPDCEDGILVNGVGALVIRDVSFTGLDLTPSTRITAIVSTGGPFTLVGGRVADNVVDSGVEALDGFFFKRGDAPGGVVVEGTVFERNTRTAASDCGLVCAVGDVTVRGAHVTDTTVTATGGGGGCGGLICVTGNVELVDSTVTSTTNRGASHCGGLVCIAGDLRIVRSSVTGTDSDVTAPGTVCGGIVCGVGDFTIVDASITATRVDETAEDLCGAVACLSGGTLALARSTLATTTVTLSGDAGGNDCAVLVCGLERFRAVNSTIADNVVVGGASLLAVYAAGTEIAFVYVTFVGNAGDGIPALAAQTSSPATLDLFASVLARSGTGGTCGPGLDVTSHGYGFADDSSCGLDGPGDHEAVGADPMLAPLADNGGPGPTMVPLATSPLVDGVPAAACQANGAAGITTDERGLPRPSALGPDCDTGAVELQPAPSPSPVPLEPTFTG